MAKRFDKLLILATSFSLFTQYGQSIEYVTNDNGDLIFENGIPADYVDTPCDQCDYCDVPCGPVEYCDVPCGPSEYCGPREYCEAPCGPCDYYDAPCGPVECCDVPCGPYAPGPCDYYDAPCGPYEYCEVPCGPCIYNEGTCAPCEYYEVPSEPREVCGVQGPCIWSYDKSCPPPVCGPRYLDRWVFSADFLIFRAHEHDLVFTCACEPPDEFEDDGVLISVVTTQTKEPHFEWDVGFRLRLEYDYDFRCGGWDTVLEWIHFNTRGRWRFDDDTRANWRLNYNVVDATLGHNYIFGPCGMFTLKPFFGLRAAVINQRLDSHLVAHLFPEDIFVPIDHSDQERFNGVGGLLGLKGYVKVSNNFSIGGLVDVAVLYGTYRLRNVDFEVHLDRINVCRGHKKSHASQVAADAALIFRWAQDILNDCATMSLELALEHHHWFDYNRIGDGDLYLNGASLSVGVHF